MEIDPAILIGQLVNLTVLIWLLRRFLYNPVLDIIERRESAIQARVAQAERLQAEAEERIAVYKAKVAALEESREAYLAQARQEADETRRRLLAEAAAAGEAARERYANQLAEERRALEQAIQEGLIAQVVGFSERVVQQLAGRSVADGLIDRFEREFHQAQREGASDALPLKAPVTLHLSFAADAAQKERLRSIILAADDTLQADDILFTHDPSLVLGLELESNGRVSTWSARDYTAALQEEALEHVRASVAAAESEVRRHG